MDVIETFFELIGKTEILRLIIPPIFLLAVMSYWQGKKLLHTLRYISDFLVAVDQALEHSLKNGYAGKRDEVLRKLQEKRKYVEED